MNIFNKLQYDIQGEWMDKDDNTEQFVFDLRTEQEKEMQAQNKTQDAFIDTIEIWEDRPTIMNSEELKRDEENLIQYANSTVHYLEE